jgi:polar amino acid transport system substrate-binding protein
MRYPVLRYLAVLSCTWHLCANGQGLRLLTEDYPPFSMLASDGSVSGLSSDLVREMFKRAGVAYRIELQPWLRAYNSARQDGHTCIYSTTWTVARAHQFKWIGPLASNPWVLYAGPASPKPITVLEDVRNFRIGGYGGDAEADYLQQQGFKVELVPSDKLNARKLLAGHIDFWATSQFRGNELVRRENLPQLRPVLAFSTAVLYLACNPLVEDVTIGRLSRALQEMRQDGFFERTTAHYFY